MSEEKRLFRFKMAMVINAFLAIVEFVFGWISASSALVADSFHVTIHAITLMVAVIVISKKDEEADARGAWWIAVLIMVLASLASIEALNKLFSPAEIHSKTMLSVSILGLLANAFVAFYLWRARHSGQSAEAYWTCLKGDLASSVATIAAAGMIFLGGKVFKPADPVAALLIAVWLFRRAGKILKGENHLH